MRSVGLGLGVLWAFICCSAPAEARTLELERGAAGASPGKVFPDRAASARRAVSLSGGRPLVRRFSTSRRIVRLTIRARGARCGGPPRMRVVLDGRRVAARAVRSRHWFRLRLAARRRAGRHTLRLAFTNPRRTRRCRRRLMLDYVAVTLRARREASRTPERVPVPPATALPPSTPPPAGYDNPVFAAPGAPDPMVLDVGDTHSDFYAFSTGERFPVLRSTDLVNWVVAQPALSERPDWAVQSGDWNPWAPSVIERAGACPGGSGTRCFVLFHVSRHGTLTPPANCIGVAVSPTPGGPYTELGPLANEDGSLDASGRPAGCGDDAGYSNIDPAPFVDTDGTPYLYLSTTRTCTGQGPGETCPPDRRISVLELAPDLLTAVGPRQALFGGNASGWELAPFSPPAPVVENPAPVRRGDTYFLLYSGGAFNGAYGMGYASSSSPTGPFVKAAENPVLAERNGVISVGGGALVTGPRGATWLAYHGREGSYANPRQLRIDPLRFPGGTSVVVDGPTSAPQSAAP